MNQEQRNQLRIYAVPGPVTSPPSRAPHRLIREGVAELLDQDVIDERMVGRA